jgi:hypothetical protein
MRNLIRNVSHNSRSAPLSTVNFAMKPRRPVATLGGTVSSDGIASLTVCRTALKLFRHSERSRGCNVAPKAFGARSRLSIPRGKNSSQIRQDPSTSLWMTRLYDHNKFSRYVFRSNGAKSSSFSPVPTKRVGTPSSSWIATTMPPLPLPSSFVTIRPVSLSALWNSRA